MREAYGGMWHFEHQTSETLLTITEAYLAINDSGHCLSLPTTGNNGDERRNCLQGGCAHIFPKEKRAICKGDSLIESFLLGFNAICEQSDISFRRACKHEKTKITFQRRGINLITRFARKFLRLKSMIRNVYHTYVYIV